MNENKALAAQQSQKVGTLAHTDASRAIAETQAALVIASQFPRNTKRAIDNIMIACQRPGLANTAVYQYAKGGSNITGPSIRLAECIAQCWGNIKFGMRTIEDTKDGAVVTTFAHDLETNTMCEKTFTVPHWRHLKNGKGYALTDPREKYENTANMGARRLRACVLAIIPGDIVESAVKECEKTMRANADCSPENIKKMVAAFDEFGVTKKMLEGRIQRRLDVIQPAQVIALQKIYQSLNDGMSGPEDWFEVETKTAGVTVKAAESDDFDFDTSKGEPTPMTPAQLTEVKSLCKKLGIKVKDRDKGVLEYFEKKYADLNIIEGQSLIDRLKKSLAKKQAAPDNTDEDALADKVMHIIDTLKIVYGETLEGEAKMMLFVEDEIGVVISPNDDLKKVLGAVPDDKIDHLVTKIAEFNAEK